MATHSRFYSNRPRLGPAIKNDKEKQKRDVFVYLLAKQHMRPVLPRNHKNPKKRTRDKTAVA